METLIKDKDYIRYLIEFEADDYIAYANFTVYEVISWDQNKNVQQTESYLTGHITWDGFCDFTFGNKGVQTLYGKQDILYHNEILLKVWDMCSTKIKNWDQTTALEMKP